MWNWNHFVKFIFTQNSTRRTFKQKLNLFIVCKTCKKIPLSCKCNIHNRNIVLVCFTNSNSPRIQTLCVFKLKLHAVTVLKNVDWIFVKVNLAPLLKGRSNQPTLKRKYHEVTATFLFYFLNKLVSWMS